MGLGPTRGRRFRHTSAMVVACSVQFSALNASGQNPPEAKEPTRTSISESSDEEPSSPPSSEFPKEPSEANAAMRQPEPENPAGSSASDPPANAPETGQAEGFNSGDTAAETPSTAAPSSPSPARLSPRVRTSPPEASQSPDPYPTSPDPPEIEPIREPTPFDQGRIRIGGGLSWTSTEDTSWTILGLGLGVFVLDGFAVETDTTFWIGGDPFVATVTPGFRYVFVMVPTIKPYVGTFYRRYFISDASDANAVGGRVGAFFLFGRGGSIGGGAVYEHIIERDVFTNRNQIYPELAFSLSF